MCLRLCCLPLSTGLTGHKSHNMRHIKKQFIFILFSSNRFIFFFIPVAHTLVEPPCRKKSITHTHTTHARTLVHETCSKQSSLQSSLCVLTTKKNYNKCLLQEGCHMKVWLQLGDSAEQTSAWKHIKQTRHTSQAQLKKEK